MNSASEKPTATIDGVEYPLENLSDVAKSQVKKYPVLRRTDFTIAKRASNFKHGT